jgi:Fur family ferric uptake transcriptional regulator
LNLERGAAKEEHLRRSTRQRTAIAAALHAANGFRSAQDLHDDLRDAGKRVGLTTVYRTLQGLADSGHVDVLRTDEGEAIYRLCPTDEHHHHLVCRSCGHSVEISSDEIEHWAERTADRHGFTHVTHTAEVYGLCRSCSPG